MTATVETYSKHSFVRVFTMVQENLERSSTGPITHASSPLEESDGWSPIRLEDRQRSYILREESRYSGAELCPILQIRILQPPIPTK